MDLGGQIKCAWFSTISPFFLFFFSSFPSFSETPSGMGWKPYFAPLIWIGLTKGKLFPSITFTNTNASQSQRQAKVWGDHCYWWPMAYLHQLHLWPRRSLEQPVAKQHSGLHKPFSLYNFIQHLTWDCFRPSNTCSHHQVWLIRSQKQHVLGMLIYMVWDAQQQLLSYTLPPRSVIWPCAWSYHLVPLLHRYDLRWVPCPYSLVQIQSQIPNGSTTTSSKFCMTQWKRKKWMLFWPGGTSESHSDPWLCYWHIYADSQVFPSYSSALQQVSSNWVSTKICKKQATAGA